MDRRTFLAAATAVTCVPRAMAAGQAKSSWLGDGPDTCQSGALY